MFIDTSIINMIPNLRTIDPVPVNNSVYSGGKYIQYINMIWASYTTCPAVHASYILYSYNLKYYLKKLSM